MLGLTNIQLAVIAMVIIAPAANGRPAWFASALVTAPIIFYLLSYRLTSPAPLLRGRPQRLLLVYIGLWFAGATASTLLMPTSESMLHYGSGFVAPFILAMALAGLHITTHFRRRFCFAVTLGSIYPLSKGLAAYYQEWGFPTLLNLITSRFDLERMQGYQDAMYGNTSNVAAYLVMVYPVTLWGALSRSTTTRARIIFTAAVILVIANALIVQSRAAILVILASTIVITMPEWRQRKYLLLLIFALLSSVVWLNWPTIEVMLDRLLLVLTLNTEDDASVSGRLESIMIGLEIFEDFSFFGVGPGMSYYYNPLSQAHQFNIQQATETGLLGLVGTIGLFTCIILWFWRTWRSISSAPQSSDFKFPLQGAAASYVVFAGISNAVWAQNAVNHWAVLFVAATFIGFSSTKSAAAVSSPRGSPKGGCR